MSLLDYFRNTCDHEWEEETRYELVGERSVHVSDDGRLYVTMLTHNGRECAECGEFDLRGSTEERCYFDYVDTELIHSHGYDESRE